jgi:hypothetical protein
MKGGIRKGEDQKKAAEAQKTLAREVLKKNEIAAFLVYLKIEYCAAQLGSENSIQPGAVRQSATSEKYLVCTLQHPFNGEDSIESDSFEDLHSHFQYAYGLWTKEDEQHRGHDHPSPKDSDIIMGEMRLQLTSVDPGKVLNEQNWHEALALTTSRQMQLNGSSKVLGKTWFATLTTSLTCPKSR